MPVIAIANQKGGTGKTTTAINLGGALAELGRRVLVVDLDPQGNATLHTGISPEQQENTIWTAMQQAEQRSESPREEEDLRALLDNLWESSPFDASLVPVIRTPGDNPFDLVPANLELSEADLLLAASVSRERRLATVLYPLREAYDYILIDSPPHLGILTLNALTAADSVIIPLEAAFFASKGMNHLFRTLVQVRRGLNSRLNVMGVLIAKVDKRTAHSTQIAAEARATLQKRVHVFQSEIPVNVELADASGAGMCITRYAPRSTGAKAYRRLAEEIEGIQHGQETA